MIQELINYINRKRKLYHWYEVRFVYKDKKHNRIFDYTQQIGVNEKSTIINHRKIKKVEQPLHKQKLLKHYLKNGFFTVEVICYLGHFKNKNK